MVGQPLAARQLDAVVGAVVVRDVRLGRDAGQLDVRLEVGDRRAQRAGRAARGRDGDRRIVRPGPRDAVVRTPPRAVREAVLVAAPDVIGADGESRADFAVHADDEFVRLVVLEIRIDRVRSRHCAGVGRIPIAGQGEEFRRIGSLYLVRLHHGVVIEIDPGIPDGDRTDRTHLARHATDADLAPVHRVVRSHQRLAVALHVEREAEPRREVVEDDPRIDAAERDGRQQRRNEGAGPHGGREQVVVIPIEPETELRRQAIVRVRVLNIRREVRETADVLPVARQADLATRGSRCAVVRIGQFGSRREASRRVSTGVAVALAEVVAISTRRP